MSSENSSIHCKLSWERHRYWMEDSKSCQFPRKALKQNIRKGIKRASLAKKERGKKKEENIGCLGFPLLHGTFRYDHPWIMPAIMRNSMSSHFARGFDFYLCFKTIRSTVTNFRATCLLPSSAYGQVQKKAEWSGNKWTKQYLFTLAVSSGH